MYTFRFNEVLRYSDLIVDGALRSLWLTGLTATLGLVIGTACAAVLTYGPKRAHGFVLAYVEAFRNTPFLVQLFFIFFGLASIGFRMAAMTAAVLALTVNFGAYTTEVMRAGLQSIPRGQLESAASLGLGPWSIFRDVVAFQAVRNVFPSLVSYVVLLFLGSSIVSQISADDLMRSASFIESRTFRSFEAYAVISAVYLGIVIAFRLGMALVWVTLFKRRG
ncbi:MAG: amino acid ABC transporter permease [Parvibaculaceae bacterium]